MVFLYYTHLFINLHPFDLYPVLLLYIKFEKCIQCDILYTMCEYLIDCDTLKSHL